MNTSTAFAGLDNNPGRAGTYPISGWFHLIYLPKYGHDRFFRYAALIKNLGIYVKVEKISLKTNL